MVSKRAPKWKSELKLKRSHAHPTTHDVLKTNLMAMYFFIEISKMIYLINITPLYFIK
jgi:hypothetical protein